MRVRGYFQIARCVAAFFVLLAVFQVPMSHAQMRINDKDMEELMKNLRDDAKNFKAPFKAALRRSVIRNTSQEKDANRLADRFSDQTEDMWKHFKNKKKADAEVQEVVDTAARLDKVVYSQSLDAGATTSWEIVRSALHEVASAYGVQEAYFPGSGQAATASDSCVASVGSQMAQRLVDRCIQVSPATHPPCNAQNACALMTDEIRRGCGLIGTGAPAFCGEYR